MQNPVAANNGIHIKGGIINMIKNYTKYIKKLITKYIYIQQHN